MSPHFCLWMHGEVLNGQLRFCTNNHVPSLPPSPTHRPLPHRHAPRHACIIEEHHVWGKGVAYLGDGVKQICLHCGEATISLETAGASWALEPRSARSPWPRARVLAPALANRTFVHDATLSSMRCQTGSPIAAHGWTLLFRLRRHNTSMR